jgi:hypothetical protein
MAGPSRFGRITVRRTDVPIHARELRVGIDRLIRLYQLARIRLNNQRDAIQVLWITPLRVAHKYNGRFPHMGFLSNFGSRKSGRIGTLNFTCIFHAEVLLSRLSVPSVCRVEGSPNWSEDLHDVIVNKSYHSLRDDCKMRASAAKF